jgi:hypothetical protein
MSKVFCNYLKKQRRFEYDLVSPCCWFSQDAKCKTTEVAGIREYLDKLEQIDDWTPECRHCKILEVNKGIKSPRLRSFEQKKFLTDTDDISVFEFQIDDECNAACLMCGEHNSTTWQKYQNNWNETSNLTSIQITNSSKEKFLQKFENIKKYFKFSSARQITFLGGEPLLSNSHVKILEHVMQEAPPGEISLSYVTNGSIRPSAEVLDVWKHFKRIDIMVSSDGTGEHFEYLRWPLLWDGVVENIKYFINSDLPNLQFNGFSYMLTPFNIFYHDRYVNWLQDFSDAIGNRQTNFKLSNAFNNPSASSGIVNLGCVPPGLREELEKKYPQDSRILKLIDPFDAVGYNRFMEYISLHDNKRKLNWRNVFPEIQQHFPDKWK